MILILLKTNFFDFSKFVLNKWELQSEKRKNFIIHRIQDLLCFIIDLMIFYMNI